LDEKRRVCFSTPKNVEDFVACLHYVKLDIVEAEKITGTRDLPKAARQFVAWGAKEVLITEQAGATLAVGDEILHAPFTNKSQVGRTGRGDTTMSAYLCRRLTHKPAEALQFAATLVSLKMETPGPFTGTLEAVEERMAREA
jgi:sugar/nucleoside kinase (ribokinase family)